MNRRRSPHYPYENPGPYYTKNGYLEFESNGHRYRIDGATVAEAAHYLAHTVKIAEHEGRRVPRGPHGLTPGAAAVLIHYGRPRLKRRKRAATRCAPCPKPRRHAKAATARRRRARGTAPRARAATRRQTAAQRTIPDFWNRTASVYGGL